MATRSQEEAKNIATTQAVIPVELHAVKNRYGPSAGAPGLRQFDRAHGAFRQQRGAPIPAVAAHSNGAGVNPPPLQLLDP